MGKKEGEPKGARREIREEDTGINKSREREIEWKETMNINRGEGNRRTGETERSKIRG